MFAGNHFSRDRQFFEWFMGKARLSNLPIGRLSILAGLVGYSHRHADRARDIPARQLSVTSEAMAAAICSSTVAPGLIVVLALVKPLSPPGDLSGQLICGPIEA